MSAWDLFQLPFMQRALIAAIFTGLAAPAVGTYLVQRRLALMRGQLRLQPLQFLD